jgi:putative transposase
VALSQERLENWPASDFFKCDLVVVQIDGLHVAEDIVLIGAIGIDEQGHKHIIGLIEGATENAAAVQVLTTSIKPGLDSEGTSSVHLDRTRALSNGPIKRCQVPKPATIAERSTGPACAGHRRSPWNSMRLPKSSVLSESRQADTARSAPRVEQHLKRSGRDPHRHPAPPPAGITPLDGLDQRHREHAGHDQMGRPQREA